MEVIKLFEEKGTVDEIGIGSVRDALSDALFPGTSVLHTRARYFLFIPWIYRYLEGRGIPSSSVAKEGRKVEVGLIETLVGSDDNAGTIGRVARHRLKLLPSTMYWSGLGAWGMRPTEQSQDQYHRSLDRVYRLRDAGSRDDDGQALDAHSRRTWHAGIPPAPAGFPKCPLSHTLNRSEAEYLREQILTRCRGTLLAHLVDICKPADDAPFVWDHPESRGFPASAQDRLQHARNFSEAILGAALLYNLMLAERAAEEGMTGADEWAAGHGESLTDWVELMNERAAEHAKWNRDEFWRLVTGINPRVPVPTRLFVDAWLNLALGGDPAGIRENVRARRLVADRERAIKGRLARLHNVEALRRWRGYSGASQLTYRWNPQVSRITSDIQRGLGRDA